MLANFDFYGKKISFGINQEGTFKTSIGGLLSIGTLALLIISILTFGSDLYHKENPNVLDQTTQPFETEPLFFSSKNYTFAIFFTDYYFVINPSSFFNISVSYQTVNNLNGSIEENKNVKMRNCTSEDFIRYPSNFLEGKLFCMDLDSFHLKGSWSENDISFITISVNRCQNSSDSNLTCASTETINQKVRDGVFLNVFTEDKSINSKNYEVPFKNYLKNSYWLLDLNIYKFAKLYLRKVSLITDDGLILPSYNEDITIKYDYIDFDMKTVYSDDPSQTLFYVNIMASQKTQEITRIYPKLQFVAAEVSGAFRLFTMFSFIALYFYSNYALTLFLINQEFNTFNLGKGLVQKKPKFNTKNQNVKTLQEEDKVDFPESIICSPVIFHRVKSENDGYSEAMDEKNFQERKNTKNKSSFEIQLKKITPSEKKYVQVNKAEKNERITKVPEIEEKPPIARKFATLENKKENLVDLTPIQQKDLDSIRNSTMSLKKFTRLNTRKSILESKMMTLTSGERKKMKLFPEKYNFEISFREYIGLKLCPKRYTKSEKKMKIFKKAEYLINHTFDARNLLKSQIDMARLKRCLFTPEQLKIYKILNKPYLFLNDNDKEQTVNLKELVPVFDVNEKKVGKTLQVVEEFIKRVTEEEHNVNYVDKMLLNMLNDDLKEKLGEE